MKPSIISLLAAVSLVASSAVLAAQDLVSDQSRVSFVSVKKGKVAEVHHFTRVTGSLNASGAVVIGIDLASVETNIPIRNERMRKYLFDVAQFPKAMVSAKVGGLPGKGQSKVIDAKIMVSMHGISKEMSVQVLAVNGASGMVVSSLQPLLIQAGDFGMDGGVEKLRELAKLPGITHAVPVSFVLTFR